LASAKIPKATAKRLPLYYRYLQFLADAGTARVSSNELAEGLKIDSATIRRDFSYFGTLGKRGYGYDVTALLAFFKKILRQDHLTTVALVGMGAMGMALLSNNFRQSDNMRIGAAFDDSGKRAGTIVDGVPVYPLVDLEKQVRDQQIHIAILAAGDDEAQALCDRLVNAGVQGIMNFTAVRLNTPTNLRVQNVDLAGELQTLIYFVDNFAAEKGK
jgi:redox-sensing transcriptional repressor